MKVAELKSSSRGGGDGGQSRLGGVAGAGATSYGGETSLPYPGEGWIKRTSNAIKFALMIPYFVGRFWLS